MKLSQTDFDRYRGNVEHEDNLINHRTSWLLISQSFLLGACINAGRYPLIVKIISISITIASAISVAAAICALTELRKQTQCGFEGVTPLLLSPKSRHICGLLAPLVVHFAFVVVWLFV